MLGRILIYSAILISGHDIFLRAVKGIAHHYVIPWDLGRGKRLYESNCAGCHGVNGKPELTESGLSSWAPQLNNKVFLKAATDGFLQATIVRGRTETAMRPFGQGTNGLVDLSMQEIDDIVAYIRRWADDPNSPMTIPAEILADTQQEQEKQIANKSNQQSLLKHKTGE